MTSKNIQQCVFENTKTSERMISGCTTNNKDFTNIGEILVENKNGNIWKKKYNYDCVEAEALGEYSIEKLVYCFSYRDQEVLRKRLY